MAKQFGVVDCVSSPGKMVNEDACGTNGAYAWVIDGATGIGVAEFLAPTGAAWLAHTLSRTIDTEIAAAPAIELDTLLVRVAAAVAARFTEATKGLPEPQAADMPSACLGLMHLEGDCIDLACIGDVSLIGVGDDGKIVAFSDRSIEPFGAKTLKRLEALRREAPDADPWPKLRQSIRRNRRRMNEPGGYFVVHPRLPWTMHMRRATFPARAQDVWLLASDGLTRLTELFGTYDVAGFYAAARERGLPELLDRLRALEDADADGDRFVRVKRHDDATGLLVRVIESPSNASSID